MKNVFTILYFSLLSLNVLWSQPFEWSPSTGIATNGNIVLPAPNNGWLVGSTKMSNAGWWSVSQWILNFNSTGTVNWEHDINLSEVGVLDDILPLPDGYLLLGYSGLCDVTGGSFLRKLDFQGNLVWHKSSLDNFDNMIQKVNGDLLLTHLWQDKFVRLDSLGNFKSEHLGQEFDFFQQLPNDFTAGIKEKKIFLLNPSDSIIKTHTFLQEVKKVQVYQDSIYALTDNKVAIFDLNLNWSHTIDFSNTCQNPSLFLVNAQGWQMIDVGTNTVALKTFDPLQNPVITYTFGLNENYEIQDMTLQGTTLAVVGKEITTAGNNVIFIGKGGNVFLKTFDLTSSPIPSNTDIEVFDLRIDSLNAVSNPACDPFNPNDYVTLYWNRVRVGITNKGTTDIESLKLTTDYDSDCLFFCANTAQVFYLDNIYLAPGDSLWLPLGDIFHNGMYNSSPFELCFWANAPNQVMDADLSDNSKCMTSIVTNTEMVFNTTIENIFPNPTTEDLFFEVAERETIESLQIINQLGQVIRLSDFDINGNSGRATVSFLPKGWYILKLKTKHGQKIGQFLKN